MKINGREISQKLPPYLIAEISCNHGGDIGLALRAIKIAKDAGADAVKFQCYTADDLTIPSTKPDFVLKGGPWKGRSLYDLYRQTQTPYDWFPWLFEEGYRRNITVFASVFSKRAVDHLEELRCPAYKIASMEITDLGLIKYAADTGKPLIISTGMASAEELTDAAKVIMPRSAAYLHCISGYPAPIEEANLRKFYPLEGISDHSMGDTIPIAATTLGAQIIEKHFLPEVDVDLPDYLFSLSASQFAEMADKVRRIWGALQPADRKSEDATRQLRRSLYAVEDIKQGERFTEQNVRSIRPAYGLPPKKLPKVLMCYAACDIESGTALTLDHCTIHPALPRAVS